jgi:NRAMP (natural resistance-associated macrophage protein)-like metal ion transporter
MPGFKMGDEERLATSDKPGAGLQGFLEELGPGLITGAADDDPSGISTYSVAGASFGYATLWTALLSFPLMAAVQLMCARLGMVTGCGLASVIRTRYSRWVLWLACSLVAIANVFNIGADLGGMAEATEMITGVRAYFWAPFFAATILGLLFWTSYRTMARIFKWLTLVLFAYIIIRFDGKCLDLDILEDHRRAGCRSPQQYCGRGTREDCVRKTHRPYARPRNDRHASVPHDA